MVLTRKWVEGLSRSALEFLFDAIDVGRDDFEDLFLFLLESAPDGVQIQQCVPSMHFLQEF